MPLPPPVSSAVLSTAPRLSPDETTVRRRLDHHQRGGPPDRRRLRGDADLNPDFGEPSSYRDAAVLVPLVAHPHGFSLIFTQRTPHLAAHAGQISFPGGRCEDDDPGPEQAALRETWEEIGLPPERVEIIGRLDRYRTRTGFAVTPVVGIIRPPFTLNLDAFEVSEAFEVPLDFFLQPDLPQTCSWEFEGRLRYFFAFPYRERFIWGATAGMLMNLREILIADSPAGSASPPEPIPVPDPLGKRS